MSKTRVQKDRASEHKRPDSEKKSCFEGPTRFQDFSFCANFQSFDFSFSTCWCLIMSNSLQSFQTILQPLRQLFEYRSNISQCQTLLHQLQQNTLSLMTPLPAQLLFASRALQQIDLELNRLEYQFLCILQLQLQHSLDTVGPLPEINLD